MWSHTSFIEVCENTPKKFIPGISRQFFEIQQKLHGHAETIELARTKTQTQEHREKNEKIRERKFSVYLKHGLKVFIGEKKRPLWG